MTVKIQSMCFVFSNHRGLEVPGAFLLMFKSCESTVFCGSTQEKSSQNQEFFTHQKKNMKWKIMSLRFSKPLGQFWKIGPLPPPGTTRMDISYLGILGGPPRCLKNLPPFFRHHGGFAAKIWGGWIRKFLVGGFSVEPPTHLKKLVHLRDPKVRG